MKVCLVGVNASYTHTSLSVRCLKKAAGDADVEIVECTINDTYEHVLETLYYKKADMYAFSCYIWNIDFILRIASAVKNIFSSCKILLGGAEVSYDAKEVLTKNSFVDFVLCGEGEVSFKELAEGAPFDKISGLVYREGSLIKENPPQLICDLGSLPRLYTKEELAAQCKKIIYYETSRGCPYNCSFCLSSTTRGVRFFPLERVFEDFKLFDDCGVELVKLVDRTFNVDEKRTNAIIEFILANTKNTSFHFEISAHSIKASTIELLRRAPRGKIQLEIGVQSTNPDTIAAINRTTDFEKLKENVLKLSENKNMHIHLDLIAGLPYEDLKSFKRSFNEVFALRPDMLQLGFLKLLKGSEIRDKAEEHDYVFLPYPPYEVISNKYISYEDVLQLKGVEAMVEKYYNSGAFEMSTEYCIKQCKDAYLFFSDLSDYFDKMGYKGLSKSRRELYDILYEAKAKDDKRLAAWILFDCIKNNKGVALPYWAERTDKEFAKKVSYYISENRNILPDNLRDEKLVDILKHVRAYPFEFNVLGSGEERKTVVLFDYLNSRQTELKL